MPRHVIVILLWVFAAAGCNTAFLRPSSSSAPIENDAFYMVTADTTDTPTSLATAYLGNADKAWQITAYNRVASLTPGTRVVIPRVPLDAGGLYGDGYQLVPVLLYPEVARHAPDPATVSANTFDQHLQYLQRNRFSTVTLDHFYGFLSLECALPPKSVIVSFDSTRRWVYDVAYPILKKRGMKAAVFIRLSEVGAEGKLTWSQLAEMAGSGFDIGILGSAIHQSLLKEMQKKRLSAYAFEFTAPQQAFKVNLRQPCRFYAYAGGSSDDLTIALLKKNGFRAAFTRDEGSNPFFTDNYNIKRAIINGHVDMAQFKQELRTFQTAVLK